MSVVNFENLPPVRFLYLRDGIEYQEACPLCKGSLQINDRDLAKEFVLDEKGKVSQIVFFIDRYCNDTLEVNLDYDSIVIRLSDDVPRNTSTWPGVGSYNPYFGKFLHGLTVDCKKCCQYAYKLMIHFDLAASVIIDTFLSSETVSLEEGDMVHEIRNVYGVNLTYYSSFSKNGDSKNTSLPLIPLNLDNPKDTVNRIRKLLIFS